ncbi:hypothetical protein JTB14_008661 [Gonioctena quinquepunctata]|nr:hypothetical protein JTB14_008661 [Gonioctena quinquepunctata]
MGRKSERERTTKREKCLFSRRKSRRQARRRYLQNNILSKIKNVAPHSITKEDIEDLQPPENSGQPKVEFVAVDGATTESKYDVVDIKSEPLEPHIVFIPETSSQPNIIEFLPEHAPAITGKHDVLDIKSERAFIPETSSQPTVEFLPEHVPTITGQATETLKKPATKKNTSNKIMCRMCLEPVTKNQMVPLSPIDVNYPGKSESFKQSKAVKIKKVVSMILVVMPDFDFDIAYNPIICHKCSALLESAYNFVEACRANEKLIHLYKAKFAPNEELISCDDVAQKKNHLKEDMPPSKKPETSHQFVRSTTVRNFRQLESGLLGIVMKLIEM